jgi:hypothetical protein
VRISIKILRFGALAIAGRGVVAQTSKSAVSQVSNLQNHTKYQGIQRITHRWQTPATQRDSENILESRSRCAKIRI